jgi:YebC/PmpR family DNA-binding regulatory protein
MSGHSKWANIKHKKGRADAQRGKIFTRLSKEITVAAKGGGGDPDMNARLRTAIDAAKSANMPADNIERSVKRGTGELEGITYEELTYEGYGPGGVAFFVESLTDNKNRTVSDMRHAFQKNGGSLAESGAVAWIFESKGVILVGKDKADEEELFLIAAEAGAEDLDAEGDIIEITTPLTELAIVKDAIEAAGVEVESFEPTRVPQNTITVAGGQASQVVRLYEVLDDNDDVQKVYANFDMDMDEMAALADAE